MHLHLEHADTGLDTRNRGLSEKLGRGMMFGQHLHVLVQAHGACN